MPFFSKDAPNLQNDIRSISPWDLANEAGLDSTKEILLSRPILSNIGPVEWPIHRCPSVLLSFWEAVAVFSSSTSNQPELPCVDCDSNPDPLGKAALLLEAIFKQQGEFEDELFCVQEHPFSSFVSTRDWLKFNRIDVTEQDGGGQVGGFQFI